MLSYNTCSRNWSQALQSVLQASAGGSSEGAPEEVCVGVGVAVCQVHSVLIMRQGEGECQGVLGAPLPTACSALVVADLPAHPEPAPALAAADSLSNKLLVCLTACLK